MKLSLLKKFSSKGLALSLSKGFTLIELLIVIAIIGILAAGILVLLDPVDKINAANDSRVQNDVSAMGRASDAYATSHNGKYPDGIGVLETSGELKRTPTAPTGYAAYASVAQPVGCTAGVDCDIIVITGELKSKKYTSVNTPIWRYESSTGKICATTGVGVQCP